MVRDSAPGTLGARVPRTLPPCRKRWNCVCSRDDGLRRHRIEPFDSPEDPDAAFARLRRLVADTPRTRVLAAEDDYLHARCRTRIGFVDDLELLLCRKARVTHVRSASRIGIYDFGVNRRRVERLRRRFEGTQPGTVQAGRTSVRAKSSPLKRSGSRVTSARA